MTKFVSALYKAYDGIDSALFEINPVLKTSDDKIMAVDAKVALDGNALYRHKDYAELRDKREEDPTEVEAGEFGLNFVKLDGNVGCMVMVLVWQWLLWILLSKLEGTQPTS